MKQTTKRALAILMVFLLCLQLSAFSLTPASMESVELDDAESVVEESAGPGTENEEGEEPPEVLPPDPNEGQAGAADEPDPRQDDGETSEPAEEPDDEEPQLREEDTEPAAPQEEEQPLDLLKRGPYPDMDLLQDMMADGIYVGDDYGEAAGFPVLVTTYDELAAALQVASIDNFI